MTDQNVCPYCGWECVEIVGSPYSGIGRGRCPNCQSNGPEVSPPSAAIDAFCHPAHLMEGKCLVSVEDLRRIVTWFYGDARTVPHADIDETLGKFKAAIDAAGGGK